MQESRDLELQPHWHRVSEAYADARIEEKLRTLDADRPQEGLRNVDRALKEAGVPAALRLHYITATAHLGRLGREAQVAWNQQGDVHPPTEPQGRPPEAE